ncbi:MmcQ/YjbR family DNA-binding protein [Mucilaginibacter gilvus]|uniref:MmcQ/YjbR family DNA-binding protein n=1 Tax=Mucilaginibacter gilvus TaxID=2305909 RepID=A0A3S3UYI7_9SPHI|nr:MmcQ/YjbR family DNA-binding protein [Mucilaginibacter gilvus]RWY53720.1 MmcQ/YjbR family DNA-binding protein [Mucilaginibacter gilvus]
MITVDTFRQIALSLPEAVEDAHFENRSFKVNKKIFATLNATENRATLKLSAINQDVFCAFDRTVVYPVPNKWGKQGWTHANLLTVREEMLIDLLKTAYRAVAPKKLGDLVTFDE